MPTLLVTSGLTPAAILRLAEENSEWEIHADLTMAKMFWAAIDRALILTPMEIQQGGVGRGSGFSSVLNVDEWKRRRDAVRSWVKARGGSTEYAKMFGIFGGDARQLHAVPEDCV